MKKLLTKGQLSVLIVFGILIIDQIIKILVKTNMYWHESIRITDWFYIYFTENNGMAFGMEIFGKLFLTTFRIVAVGLIIWYLAKIVKQNYKTGYIVCISLILAGAIGNIIDSVFYGVIFNESTHSTIASFVPVGEGYSEWLHGKVVDMLLEQRMKAKANKDWATSDEIRNTLTALGFEIKDTKDGFEWRLNK